MPDMVKKVQTDKISGSFDISQKSLQILYDYIYEDKEKNNAIFVDKLNSFGKELIKAQPNMVLLRKRVLMIIYHIKRLSKTNRAIDEIKSESLQKIREVMKTGEQKRKKIGSIGAKLILNQSKILTISSSSLVKEIFFEAKKLNRKFTVYCLESRPKNEPEALARDLAAKGIPSVLSADAMMGWLLEEVNMVLCGADRIFESGFVNKVGTLPLAIAAYTKQIPFYIAAETDKVLKEIERTLRFYPESPSDITNKKHKLLKVYNYYFEAVPFKYVSKLICEDGVFEVQEFSNWYLED
jgi:translation initiation factor 2B subunit (eIF-2B alpha/beta/delta family)